MRTITCRLAMTLFCIFLKVPENRNSPSHSTDTPFSEWLLNASKIFTLDDQNRWLSTMIVFFSFQLMNKMPICRKYRIFNSTQSLFLGSEPFSINLTRTWSCSVYSDMTDNNFWSDTYALVPEIFFAGASNCPIALKTVRLWL